MLPFLLPSTAALRASAQLARRLQATAAKQTRTAQRCASTLIEHADQATRTEEDAEDIDDCSRPTRHRSGNAAFSQFFDKRTPLSTESLAPTSNKARASHEIASASRRAVSAFRQAIGTKAPAIIIEAYADLIRAQQRHADDVRISTSRAVQASDVGFPIRKNDIQTAIRHLVQHAQKEGYMDTRIVECCHQMFQDMAETFGFRIGPADLHRQLQTYCLARSARFDPRQAFRQLRASYQDWQTTSVEWNMVINYYVQRQSYSQGLEVWKEMREFGVEPETQLRNTMIRTLLSINDVAGADAQLQSLAQQQGHLGIDTLTTTVEGLCKLITAARKSDHEFMAKLRSYATDLRKAVESSTDSATDVSAWHTLLRYEAVVGDPAHALETARQAYQPDLFDFSTLLLLLRLHSDELSDVQSSDEAVELLDRILSAIDPKRNIQPDDQCYSILLLGLLQNPGFEATSVIERQDAMAFDRTLPADEAEENSPAQQPRPLPTPNQVREAQLLYDHARSIGIPPTASLVTPLLNAYCDAFLPSLPSAMSLVQDMLDYRSRSNNARKAPGAPRRKISSSSTAPVTVGIDVIKPVLDACVKLRDISSARDLLSRLHSAGIPITATHKAQLMNRLISITTSWPEAFQIYRSITRFTSSTSSSSLRSRTRVEGLDEKGYISLLQTLRRLSFPDLRAKARDEPLTNATLPAPPEELLGIVEDMRASGHRPSCAIYTGILDYYAKSPLPSYVGVKATHEMLKQDEGLEPDLPLINALMNAYNRVDEPAMVLAIWDSLLATRQEIDGVTLSVFFDTAGRHGLLSLARKAITTIRRIEAEAATQRREGTVRRSAMSKGAWDSWLECLARCGRLEEAIELVFGEMRRVAFREAIAAGDLTEPQLSVTDLIVKSTQAPVRDKKGQVVGPDAKTLGTLLKFAARERDRRQKRFLGAVLPAPPSSSTASKSASAAAAGTDGRSGTSIWHILRSRIREELSWLYPQIKHIGEQTLL